jgi:cystathionine beta-lyase family protein involved in aluminum resistance
MPYIEKYMRERLVGDYPPSAIPETAGELNFMITVLVDEYIQLHGKRYDTLNEVIGVLECAKLELYRRVVAPYEDTKIEQNGDVYK